MLCPGRDDEVIHTDGRDSVTYVVRRPLLLLAFGALGLPACLLYTDPINDPPSVKVTVRLSDTDAHRNQAVTAVADVHDAQDDVTTLRLSWATIAAKGDSDGCGWVNATEWNNVPSQAGNADHTFTFTPTSLNPVCLCARVLDAQGAASVDCAPLRPVNHKPIAVLEDVTGVASGQTRPLYSQVHLTAGSSSDLDGDDLRFTWSQQFPAGVKTSECADPLPAGQHDRHLCFVAEIPGDYTVTVTVTDRPDGQPDTQHALSDSAVFKIRANEDAPPCLQSTDPDLHAKRIVLSRTSELGGKYESRTFTVNSASDDGEPYPQVAGSTRVPAHFVWYAKDPTAATPKWQQRIENSPSLTISQADFPRALPGDTVQLRVEARDTQVEAAYKNHLYNQLNHGGLPCDINDEMCCTDAACSCVRWTTWTVQFQP